MTSARLLLFVFAAFGAYTTAHGDVPLGGSEGEFAFKERIFLADMLDRFVIKGQAMCKLNVPTEQVPFITYNMPDNAYMTGIYLGALSLKYAVTQDAETRKQAGNALKGLDLLCNVTGIEGLLARAAVKLPAPIQDDGEWSLSPDNQYVWRGDVSSDQMDGVFFGFALAYDHVANKKQRKRIKKNVQNLVDYLVACDLHIIDIDGEPTTWGHYEPEYVMNYENMNALLLLQHLKIAEHVTGKKKYRKLYRKYANKKGYADIAITARVMGDPITEVNHSDDVLQFLAYYPLLRLESDPTLRAKYLASLQRSWDGDDGYPGLSEKGCPLYAAAADVFLNDTSGNADAINSLNWFPFGIKWAATTITDYENEFGFTDDPSVESPEPGPGEMVPIDRRPNTWSTWVQNPYVAGDRNPSPGQEFNGHDYLIGYWLLRYEGIIGADA